MPSRRTFLKVAGGGAVVAAAGGAGFALTRRPSKALEPWDKAGSDYKDPMRRALSYAILSPSSHNLQPWIVELRGDMLASLFRDPARSLPTIDPFDRQTIISLGCFLETLAIVASQDGYRAIINTFPKGVPEGDLDGRPVAYIKLVRDEALAPDPLFSQILGRRTDRDIYDAGRPIPAADLAALGIGTPDRVNIGFTAAEDRLDALRELTRDAMVAELNTPAAHNETVGYMRIGKSEIEANPDGISLGGPFLEILSLVGMLSRKTLADPESAAYQATVDMTIDAAMSAMAFTWISTPGNSRRDQINAGRTCMRQWLTASGKGIALQPMSQVLQEYAEMQPFFEKAHAMLAETPGERVQMLMRLGYSAKGKPSPRWPLDVRLRAA